MSSPLSRSEIEDALEELDGWSYEDDRLVKTFTFEDFQSAMGFIVRVGFLAEDAGHHPELENVYDTVTLAFTTHDAGGKVTRKDVDIAHEIEAI